MESVGARLLGRRLPLVASREALDFLADVGYDPAYGARPIQVAAGPLTRPLQIALVRERAVCARISARLRAPVLAPTSSRSARAGLWLGCARLPDCARGRCESTARIRAKLRRHVRACTRVCTRGHVSAAYLRPVYCPAAVWHYPHTHHHPAAPTRADSGIKITSASGGGGGDGGICSAQCC
jgi:hypothetical protein